MPDDILFVEEIPLGATGKVDKKAIRAGLDGYELPFDGAPADARQTTHGE